MGNIDFFNLFKCVLCSHCSFLGFWLGIDNCKMVQTLQLHFQVTTSNIADIFLRSGWY